MRRSVAAMLPAIWRAGCRRLWRQRIEVRAITDDVLGSFGVGMLCVLLSVVGYFFYKAYQARAGRGHSGLQAGYAW